jgi:carbon-monoxide dehydrogenase medium subunit
MSSTDRRWISPESVQAAAVLASAGATVVGGGALLFSQAFPTSLEGALVDLSVLGLGGCEPPIVGAQVPLQQLLDRPQLNERWPTVYDALAATASPGVRRLATVGGTIAAALPSSDLLTALCAVRARVQVTGSDADEWLTVHDYLTSRPAGIVTTVDLGRPRPGGYLRLGGRPDPAPAVVTVAIARHGPGWQVWAGGLGPRPRAIGLDDPISCDATTLVDAWPASYRERAAAALRAELVERHVTPPDAPAHPIPSRLRK